MVGFCEAVVFVFGEEGAEVGCCCSYYGVHEEGGLWWSEVSFDVACCIREAIGLCVRFVWGYGYGGEYR